MQVSHTVHIAQRNIAIPLKGAEICKIGDAGHTDHSHIQQLTGGIPAETFSKTVLIVDVHMRIWHNTYHRNAAQVFQNIQAGSQDVSVTTELVDNGTLDPCFLILLQQSYGSVKLSKHTAAVDIAHQQNRCIHQLSKSHVYDIFLLEVDLCRTTCAFNHDNIVISGKAVIGLHNCRNILPLAAVVFHGTHVSLDNAIYDDLAAHIGGGL